MNSKIITAIYPGTFDPLTLGHQDIIERSSRLCHQLYIGVAAAHHKNTLFSIDQRVAMIENVLTTLNVQCPITVIKYDGLLIDTCQNLSITQIIRGVRMVADYEYELQLALMNRHLNPSLETIFIPSDPHYAFISSTLVREIAKLGGDLDDLVAPNIKMLIQKTFTNHEYKI